MQKLCDFPLLFIKKKKNAEKIFCIAKKFSFLAARWPAAAATAVCPCTLSTADASLWRRRPASSADIA